MAEYRVTIKGFDSGLNELLAAQKSTYDRRTKRMRVANPEKAKNDKLCLKNIWRDMHGVTLHPPISIHYNIFVKDKRHDRMNIVSALDKSFCDALQMAKCLQNDGFEDITEVTWEMHVDKNNPRILVTIKEL